MGSKVVISVITLVLLVGLVLGVVVVVIRDHGKADKEATDISTNTKIAEVVCKPTEFQEACNKVMAEVAKNSSATYQDYVIASIRATADELQKALDNSTPKDNNDDKDGFKTDINTYDMDNCQQMLAQATDELQQVLKVVSETHATSIPEQIDPILVWLTAVRAYQSTCVDQIQDPQQKAQMQQVLQASNELTFNAQKIVYNAHDILEGIGGNLGDFKLPPIGNRKLLHELHEIDRYGFPSWVPASDRKLLGRKNGEAIFKTPTPPPVPSTVTPNAVVAQDGSGDFKTIKAAVEAYPTNQQGRYIIYIKEGVYDEGQVVIGQKQSNVYMYGDGKDKTIITGDLNMGIKKVGTAQSATVVAIGERFMAKGITFQNTAGTKGQQAVAFRSTSPHTVMIDCGFDGYQDTLYYHTHDQFYKNCVITGTVDFIFGSGRAFIQDSEIHVKGQGYVTADGRVKYEEAGGVVLHNCKIMAAPELQGPADIYLGRPWKASATSVIMKCDVENIIKPEGWSVWKSTDGANNHMTCMFREYDNTGPGSNTNNRVTWPGFKVIADEKDAIGFTAGTFLDGDSWIAQYGVPVNLGL